VLTRRRGPNKKFGEGDARTANAPLIGVRMMSRAVCESSCVYLGDVALALVGDDTRYSSRDLFPVVFPFSRSPFETSRRRVDFSTIPSNPEVGSGPHIRMVPSSPQLANIASSRGHQSTELTPPGSCPARISNRVPVLRFQTYIWPSIKIYMKREEGCGVRSAQI
jgi:hypothetical protein